MRRLAFTAGFVLGLASPPAPAEVLTTEERAWLQAHPVIRVAPSPDYAPVEFVDEGGHYRGITADCFALIEQRLGIRFQIVRLRPGERPSTENTDVVPLCAVTPERMKVWRLTSTYLEFPVCILARSSVAEPLTLDKLAGARVAVVGSYAARNHLAGKHPDLLLDPVADTRTGLRKVSFGLVDAFVSDLPVATYWMEHEGIANLKVAGETDLVYRMAIASRMDWPVLQAILEKGLALVTPEERQAIYRRWVPLAAGPALLSRRFLTGLMAAMAVTGVAVLGVLLWNRSLSRQVKRRTEQLHSLYAGLQQSEARTKEIVDSALDAVITFDQDGRITGWNPQAERLLGWTAEEARGMDVVEIAVPAWDRERHRAGLARFRTSGQAPFVNRRQEMIGLHRDGHEFPVELSVVSLRSREAVAFCAFVRDIGERRRAEEERSRFAVALEAAAAEWGQTFDAIESPVLVLAADGRIRRMNTSAAALLGAEGAGRPLRELATSEPWREGARLVELAVRGRSSVAAQAFDPGTGRTWDLAASLVPAAGSDQPRVILVVRDLTPLVRLQESLRRREKMSAMGTLLAGVAHEVRNPLFGISANLDALAARFGQTEQIGPFLRNLRGEVERLRRLMSDLLEFGKPSMLELRAGPLDEVVTQAVGACAPLAARSEVTVRQEVRPGLARVLMDHGRLAQVFQNLIENAIQHSPAGRTVSVEVGPVQEDGRTWAEIVVRDCGSGFRAEDLPRLFEPFFTRRRGGTGLGLSIVQRIVDQHGGLLSAENDPKGGARVTVRLPLHG
jgi:PAS domain S-box-containing protein